MVTEYLTWNEPFHWKTLRSNVDYTYTTFRWNCSNGTGSLGQFYSLMFVFQEQWIALFFRKVKNCPSSSTLRCANGALLHCQENILFPCNTASTISLFQLVSAPPAGLQKLAVQRSNFTNQADTSNFQIHTEV